MAADQDNVNFMSSYEDLESAVTAEAESPDNLPATTSSPSSNMESHLRKTIELLKAELEAKDARLTEAAFHLRAAARNKARLEDEKAALLKKEKPRVFEIAKLNKENSILIKQIELLRRPQDPAAFPERRFDVRPTNTSSENEECLSDRSGPQDHEKKLMQCQVQMNLYHKRMNEAAKGWECCEERLSNCTARIASLEGQLEVAAKKITEQDVLLSESQKVNSIFSVKLLEESNRYSQLNESFASDFQKQKSIEVGLHQQIMHVTLQSALTKDDQDSTIKTLSEDVETLNALLSNERSRCKHLESHIAVLGEQYDAIQKSRDELFLEKSDVSSQYLLLQGIAAAMQTDLQKTSQQLRIASDVQLRLNQMCEGEGVLGQKKLQEELNFCLSLMDQHRQKLKKASEGWNTSEEKASVCEQRIAELQAQLASTADTLERRDAEIESMRRGGMEVNGRLSEALCANEAVQAELERHRTAAEAARLDLAQALRQSSESQAASNSRVESLSGQLSAEREARGRLEDRLGQAEAEAKAAADGYQEALGEKTALAARCVLLEEVADSAHAQLAGALEQLKSAEGAQERSARVLEGREFLGRRGLEEQLAQAVAQARLYQDKLSLAAIGWETCEARVAAHRRRAAELEAQVESAQARAAGLQAVADDLHNLNAVLATQLAEASRPGPATVGGKPAAPDQARSAEGRRVRDPAGHSAAGPDRDGLAAESRRVARTGRDGAGRTIAAARAAQGGPMQSPERDEAGQVARLQVEALRAAHEASEAARAALERERGELLARCRALEGQRADSGNSQPAAARREGGGGGGGGGARLEVLERETERMAAELAGRNAVESQLRAELFHALARLSQAEDALRDAPRAAAPATNGSVCDGRNGALPPPSVALELSPPGHLDYARPGPVGERGRVAGGDCGAASNGPEDRRAEPPESGSG
jgi:hypothetical protein